MIAQAPRLFALVFSIGAVAACSSNAGLECGVNTHQEGAECLADDPDAANIPDGGGSVSDANRSTDSNVSPESSVDAGPVVKDGDPCPNGNRSACTGNHIFGCQLAPNGTHPIGTLWDAQNCNLLAGTCVIDHVGNASCAGGGYTSCVVALNDAGNQIDSSRCYDATVVEQCLGGYWSPMDCSQSGLVCRPKPSGPGASCGP